MKRMRMIVFAALGLVVGVPAALSGETLSTETLLAPVDAGKSEFYPGGKDSYYPGAAFGKDVHLIVWQAGRMQEGDIVACRVDKSGKALDDKPFVVSSATELKCNPM